MAIVAIFDSINQIAPDRLQLSGTLTDQASFKVPFATEVTGTITRESIRSQVASLLDATQSQDEVKKVLQIGVPFDLTPPVIVPDPKAAARLQFFADFQRLQRANQMIASGIKVDPNDLQTLLNLVNSEYLAEYL